MFYCKSFILFILELFFALMLILHFHCMKCNQNPTLKIRNVPRMIVTGKDVVKGGGILETRNVYLLLADISQHVLLLSDAFRISCTRITMVFDYFWNI